MFHQSLRFLCLLLPALALLAAVPAGAQEITGVGATIPAPLYSKWAVEYKEQTGVTVNYEFMGSGYANKTVAHAIDFGASDAPMNGAEMQAAPGILHIPTVVHAVALVYNLPGLKATLHLTGPVVADIYLGKITRWNDPQIARLNPGLTLSDLAIFPVHLASGGGTTYLLTTYFSAVNSAWQESVGAGKSVHWPIGLGGKQGAGVAHLVQQNVGGLGFMAGRDAVMCGLPIAAIQNAKGSFVSPTIESTVSAAGAVKLTPDLRGRIVNSPAQNGYPIVGFTYLLSYRTHTRPEVKDYLTWCLTTGQKDAADLLYGPLPSNVQKRALALVAGMK